MEDEMCLDDAGVPAFQHEEDGDKLCDISMRKCRKCLPTCPFFPAASSERGKVS